jgi:hypothetical protein
MACGAWPLPDYPPSFSIRYRLDAAFAFANTTSDRAFFADWNGNGAEALQWPPEAALVMGGAYRNCSCGAVG